MEDVSVGQGESESMSESMSGCEGGCVSDEAK